MINPGPGVLLIADPFLKDPNFLRSVVLLCEHKEEGSFGFVLNRPYENTLGELLPDMKDRDIPVYYGGPVQMDSIHFLHQYPKEIPGGQEVIKGVYWGGDFEAALALISNPEMDVNRIRFFIGYSGWSEGQLRGELDENTWLTVMGTRKLIFHRNYQEIWKDSLKHLGGDYEIMVNFPIDPTLN